MKVILAVRKEQAQMRQEKIREFCERSGSSELFDNGDWKCLLSESGSLASMGIPVPDVDGLELCKELQSQLGYPVVVLMPPEARTNTGGFTQKTENSTPKHGDILAQDGGALQLDEKARTVLVRGNVVELKNKEFELLHYLMMNPGTVFDKEHLYKQIWGEDARGDSSTVTVHVNRIRNKIEEVPSHPSYIQTVWGVGYRFRH